MKKILGIMYLVFICLVVSLYAGGRIYSLRYDVLVDTDSTSDSLSFAPDSGRMLVSSGARNVGTPYRDRTFVGTVVVGASTNSILGESDTVIITLSTSMSGFVTFDLDSVKTTVPGTLYVAYGATLADTLLKRNLIVSWRIYDTSGGLPGIVGATYPITFTAIGRD